MKYIYIFTISCLILSCSSDSSQIGSIDNYNRTAILENITENIIIPAHENLQIKVINLNASSLEFTSLPNTTNLGALREAWKETYIAWQYVEMFNIGKAEQIDYNKTMNTYPCNTTNIENNITSGEYDLSLPNALNWASQGLPALDYMLYGLDNDSNNILALYSTNANKYLNYLNNLINHMLNNTNDVTDYWQTNKNNFISLNTNTATSSLNLLTNDFIYYYEKGLRANKIGIPCGKWDNWNTYEKGVEAYYRKDLSKDLTLEAINACKKFFSGIGLNSNISGESYINYLNAISGDNSLSNNILNQLDLAEEKVNNLNANFVHQMSTDNIPMLEAYDELQRVVVLLKTDMLINLSITVDYQDADGD